jgi:hypothetical protein
MPMKRFWTRRRFVLPALLRLARQASIAHQARSAGAVVFGEHFADGSDRVLISVAHRLVSARLQRIAPVAGGWSARLTKLRPL